MRTVRFSVESKDAEGIEAQAHAKAELFAGTKFAIAQLDWYATEGGTIQEMGRPERFTADVTATLREIER